MATSRCTGLSTVTGGDRSVEAICARQGAGADEARKGKLLPKAFAPHAECRLSPGTCQLARTAQLQLLYYPSASLAEALKRRGG